MGLRDGAEERERKGKEKAEEGAWMDRVRQITGAGRSGVETQGDSLATPEHRQGGHHAPGGTAFMRLQRSPLAQHPTLSRADLLTPLAKGATRRAVTLACSAKKLTTPSLRSETRSPLGREHVCP